jgi:hypothetical protein
MNTETVQCNNIPLPISRVGLGTWAIGGWMWGGSDESASIKTIQHAVDKILGETIKNPVGPEFMAPPSREPVFA